MPKVLLTVITLFTFPSPAAAGTAEQDLLNVVRGFYGWVLRNGDAVNRLQPTITSEAGTNRLTIDMSNMPQFTSRFMGSGYFATSFSESIRRYYAGEQTKLDALSKDELDQLAKDGRGPLMDTENMDIFFCAQEYEYDKAFVQKLRIASSTISANHATAIVISPLDWKTTFNFTKVKGRWRIAGYCVYQ